MKDTILIIGVVTIAYLSYKVGKLVGKNDNVDRLRKELDKLTKEEA